MAQRESDEEDFHGFNVLSPEENDFHGFDIIRRKMSGSDR